MFLLFSNLIHCCRDKSPRHFATSTLSRCLALDFSFSRTQPHGSFSAGEATPGFYPRRFVCLLLEANSGKSQRQMLRLLQRSSDESIICCSETHAICFERASDTARSKETSFAYVDWQAVMELVRIRAYRYRYRLRSRREFLAI